MIFSPSVRFVFPYYDRYPRDWVKNLAVVEFMGEDKGKQLNLSFLTVPFLRDQGQMMLSSHNLRHLDERTGIKNYYESNFLFCLSLLRYPSTMC